MELVNNWCGKNNKCTYRRV